MFEKIIELIERHDSIVLFGHDFPDGDCYGSQIGLRDSLRLTYPDKKVYAVGSGLKYFFKKIGYMDDIGDDVIKDSLAILLDGNDLSRMEDSRVYLAKAFCKIDHHIENGKFHEGPFVLNPKACSTCELVLDMIYECNLKVDEKVANAIYLGMLTDSGRFQYNEDFVKAFKDAAFLCENGANPQYIVDKLNVTDERSLSFRGYIYTHYQTIADHVIYCYLDKETLDKFHIDAHKAATNVNLLSNVRGYPVWAFFCEIGDGSMKVEFRSSGAFVQKVATKYGGGGHAHACGCTIPNYKRETTEHILKDLCDLVDSWEREN